MTQEPPPLKNCLCVDLDPDFYYLLQSYAQRSKFLMIWTSQGQQALKLVQSQPMDVILMEADVTRGSPPWDILHALKADEATKTIPVVIFSWLAVEEASLAEGADVFVQKPVMYADFIDVLALVGVTNPLSDASPERR